VTADVAKGRVALPSWVGVLSTIPLVLLVAGALGQSLSWDIVAVSAYVISYLLSVCFASLVFEPDCRRYGSGQLAFFFLCRLQISYSGPFTGNAS
jgi:hypothetical protein